MKKQNFDPFANLILDEEEKQIEADIEAGKYMEVENLEELKDKYQAIAKNTLNKQKNINIRISLRDLDRLKTKAMENSIPYQTLINLILKQYTSGKIKISL